VIAVAAVAGFTKAENERIRLFFVPLLCVATAEQLPPRRVRPCSRSCSPRRWPCQLLFYTVW
jgi:hypothetical protein